LDSSSEHGTAVPLQIGAGAEQRGDGGVEAGELFVGRSDDSALLGDRRQ